nr:GNAT family N-acetyltransferase [Herbidospora sakaeratensis]
MEHFHVDPGHQGRGLGRAVLTWLLERFDHDGVTVRLNVLRSSPTRRQPDRGAYRLRCHAPTAWMTPPTRSTCCRSGPKTSWSHTWSSASGHLAYWRSPG